MFAPLLAPMLAMVALTFVAWTVMYTRRLRYMHQQRIAPDSVQTSRQRSEVLTDVMPASDHVINLFEMPVLFYVWLLVLMHYQIFDAITLALAWGFVLFRGLHTAIHLTSNRVIHRFAAYIVSSLILFAAWLRLGIGALT